MLENLWKTQRNDLPPQTPHRIGPKTAASCGKWATPCSDIAPYARLIKGLSRSYPPSNLTADQATRIFTRGTA